MTLTIDKDIRKYGFVPHHIEAVRDVASYFGEYGVHTDFAIGFGSRSRNEGRIDSDVDLLIGVDFTHARPNLDPNLTLVRQRGGGTFPIQTEEDFYHLHIIKTEIFLIGLHKPWFLQDYDSIAYLTQREGLLQNAQIMYGEEPTIKGKTIRQFSKVSHTPISRFIRFLYLGRENRHENPPILQIS